MCGGSHKKRLRSAGDASSSDERDKSSRKDGIERAGAGSMVTSSDLTGTCTPRWDMANFDIHDDGDVDFVKHYAEEGYCSSAVVVSDYLVREAARESSWRTNGSDQDNSDAIYCVLQSKVLNSCRFFIFPVKGQVGWLVVNGTISMVVYGRGLCIGRNGKNR